MFRLTNVIPERIIFVSRGITVHSKCACHCAKICRQEHLRNEDFLNSVLRASPSFGGQIINWKCLRISSWGKPFVLSARKKLENRNQCVMRRCRINTTRQVKKNGIGEAWRYERGKEKFIEILVEKLEEKWQFGDQGREWKCNNKIDF